ncbi:MAG: hypothetical protein K2P58_04145 [Hyphomonadaceae bacterium]|nr:hypothetical protein [Hyphomonadaceae bacterium]
MTSEADIAARLVAALAQAAAREGASALVSATIDVISSPADGEARVELNRKTRTLLFLRADYVGVDGARLAAASSVHAIKD